MPASRVRLRLLVALLAAAAARAPAATPAAVPEALAAFQAEVSPVILARRPVPAKHWRQIEPAVHRLALAHADRLAALDAPARAAVLADLAAFIDARRAAAGPAAVLAPDRAVIGLLDPTRGLGPREITAIATAYGCAPQTILKQDAPGETLDSVAADFLAAVQAVAAAGAPATVIVLGHGLPTEIQSYRIPVERLAAALLDGAAARPGAAVDLGHLVLVCDDCFSADFLENLCASLAAGCRARGLALQSVPVCVAGTNHGRVGHAVDGEKFVPFFWRDVLELYFIRRPHPPAVVLRHFFDNVDAMMYGHGRAPVMQGADVVGWRLVDPDLVQDPVVIVPLDEPALAELRRILGLPAATPLPPWLDVG